MEVAHLLYSYKRIYHWDILAKCTGSINAQSREDIARTSESYILVNISKLQLKHPSICTTLKFA